MNHDHRHLELVPQSPAPAPPPWALDASSPRRMDILGRAHVTPALDTEIAWGEMGAGEPLVLLHGLQDSHRCWRRVAPILAKRFRVLMPDLAGHGHSGRPDAPYSLSWHARVLASWMETIGVSRAHLCGHSFGGGVAQWMVLEHRPRVRRLALVAPGGLGREVALGMRFAAFPVLGRKLTPHVLRVAIPAALRFAPEHFGHMEPEEQERYIRMNRIPGSDRAFQRTLESVVNLRGQYVQTLQRAGEVAEMPPVALFWGEKDPILPVKHGWETLERTAHIHLTTYDRCGHFPHLDQPARLAADLEAFFRDRHRLPARIL